MIEPGSFFYFTSGFCKRKKICAPQIFPNYYPHGFQTIFSIRETVCQAPLIHNASKLSRPQEVHPTIGVFDELQ
jgi:hypothetical protein